MKDLVIVTARYPRFGQGKTRLAKQVGKQKALEIEYYLLGRTLKQLIEKDRDKGYDLWIVVPNAMDIPEMGEHTVIRTPGNDLPAQIRSAYKLAFDWGYEQVVMLPGDLGTWSIFHAVMFALGRLREHDAVIYPNVDGGFSPHGLSNKKYAKEFVNTATRKNDIFVRMVKRLEKAGADVWVGRLTFDIDRQEDWELFCNLKKIWR